jgi:acid phosphatase
MIVILENANYGDALAQPFLGNLAKSGALLSQFHAEARPSLPNYIALTAGTTAGVTSNGPVNLDLRHIGDLLEAKGKRWKVYTEGYPGRCFLGNRSGNYVRKHVPFLSFENIQKDAHRCANVIEASALNTDVATGNLPDYSLYIPDEKNDGHATGPAFADRWMAQVFGPLMKNHAFMKGLLLVVTFDEADKSDPTNRIFTALTGEPVLSGSVSKNPYNHYSLLRTIENALSLGTLGQKDASASPIAGVWR